MKEKETNEKFGRKGNQEENGNKKVLGKEVGMAMVERWEIAKE